MKNRIVSKFCLHVFSLMFLLRPSVSVASHYANMDSVSQMIEKIGLSDVFRAEETIGYLAENLAGKIPLLYWQSTVDYVQGKSDSMRIPVIRALLDGENGVLSEPFDKALLYLSLTVNYTAESRYADAFHSGLTALECFEQTGNRYFTAKTLSMLGNICTYIRAYKMAESYYGQALRLVSPGQFEYYQLRLNLSKIFFYIRPIEATVDTMLSLLPLVESYDDTGLLSIACLNLATCFVMQEQYEKAGLYYRRALELSDEIANNKLYFTLYQGLGLYFFYTGDIEKSFAYFRYSQQIAIADQNKELLSYALYNLGFIHEKNGQKDSALLYMKEYIEVSRELANNSGAMDAYRAYVSVVLEASEDKLTIARQQIALKNKNLTALAMIFIAVILSGILLFVFFWQRKRRQTLIRDMEKKELENRLENERKLKQLQTKRHKENMEAKAREITSYSLLLSNKNQVLQQISAITGRMPVGSEVAEINRIIKSNLNTDEAWEDFMLHFQKIHPKFFHRLKGIPNAKKLTENELRLCAYFRIGMSTKQIAQVLNVSPESIRIHRYRLKKKLNLNETDDLDDFIRNI